MYGINKKQNKSVDLGFSEGYQKINSDVLPIIEYEWGKIIAKRKADNKKIWNEKLFRVQSLNEKEGAVSIQLENTSYKKTYCTNNLHVDIAEKYGEDFLGNNIGLFAVVQTRDGLYPLGRRVVEKDVWSFVSGMVKNNSVKPEQAIKSCLLEEIEEELNVSEKEVAEIEMVGIERGLLKHYDFVFLVTLNINAITLRKKLRGFENEEHSEIQLFETMSLVSLSENGKLKNICQVIVDKFIVKNHLT